MLLAWRAEQDSNNAMAAAAKALDDGLDALLATPDACTTDLGGPLGTEAFGDAVAAKVKA
jgi:3-isopropylmalate dehydrogenase